MVEALSYLTLATSSTLPSLTRNFSLTSHNELLNLKKMNTQGDDIYFFGIEYPHTFYLSSYDNLELKIELKNILIRSCEKFNDYVILFGGNSIYLYNTDNNTQSVLYKLSERSYNSAPIVASSRQRMVALYEDGKCIEISEIDGELNAKEWKVPLLDGIESDYIIYFNGRFIINDKNSDYIYWSELDELKFESGFLANPRFDTKIISMAVYENILYLFGANRISLFSKGNTDAIPIIPYNVVYDISCKDRYSVKTFSSGIVFLGNSGGVWTLMYRPPENRPYASISSTRVAKISTNAVDYALIDKKIKLLSYTLNGIEFIYLEIEGEDLSVSCVFDTEMGEWYERGFVSSSNKNKITSWGLIDSFTVQGVSYVSSNSSIYIVSTPSNKTIKLPRKCSSKRINATGSSSNLSNLSVYGNLKNDIIVNSRVSSDCGYSFFEPMALNIHSHCRSINTQLVQMTTNFNLLLSFKECNILSVDYIIMRVSR